MKVVVLGSGSEGNAILVTHGKTVVLVDAGFSGSIIEERARRAGFSLFDVTAVLLTHEHSDHVRGAGVIARRFNLPVFATEGTFRSGRVKLGSIRDQQLLEGGKALSIQDLWIHPFSVSHDAEDPVGFVIDDGKSKLGICTDSGCITQLMRYRLQGCDALILESNHDPNMLLAGSYPWELKQRIRSRIGHLSNDDAGTLCEDIWHAGLRHIFLAHLSKENNLPDLARMAVQDALYNAGCRNGETRVHVVSQTENSEVITI
ncbi:MAG: MBL fold metallo-hydrolase [bacterium]